MNIINEREQSNGNNIVVESSAANNHVNHYAFNPNGLRYYYNIHNESKNFIYIVFNLLVWASYITGLFYLDELSIEKVSPNYHPFFFGIVSYYPDCRDLRLEVWRFFTMSFVHSNIKHIICNTVILFPLMYIV